MHEGRKEQKPLNDMVCDDIVRIGPKTLFGLQGDYNIALLKAAQDHPYLRLIHTASDSEVGIMADGYGRVHSSRLGVCSSTHNTGTLLAIAGVAGAEAERQSVVMISGCPNDQSYSRGLLQHHTYEDYDTSQSKRAYAAACHSAQHSRTATEALSHINTALRHSPASRHSAFVEVPINLWAVPVDDAAVAPPSTSGMSTAVSDRALISRWMESLMNMVQANLNGRFLMVIGRDVDTYACHDEVKALVNAINCNVVTTMCGKTAFENSDPRWIGTYWGLASTPACLKALEECDVCFVVGMLPFDYGCGGFTVGIDPHKRIRLDARGASTPTHVITSMNAGLFRLALHTVTMAMQGKRTSVLLPTYQEDELMDHHEQEDARDEKSDSRDDQAGNGMSFTEFRKGVGEALQHASHREEYFFETGTSWWIARDLRYPSNARVHTQILFGMLGWALHAATGAAAALVDEDINGRSIAVFGDGAFQIMVSGVHSACKYRLPVTYVLIDNGLYGVENGIAPGKINELVDWDYGSIMRGMAGRHDGKANTDKNGKHDKHDKHESERLIVHDNVDTQAKLTSALLDARTRGRTPVFIHVRINRKGYAPSTLKTWAKGVLNTNHYPAPPEYDPFGNVW